MNQTDELEALHAEIRTCTRCPLHSSRVNAVPGEGDPHARMLFVGEAPGATEDKMGRPFVGRSGQLLTKLLSEIELNREDVFITSVLKCRPPRNRTPHSDEIKECLPFLDRQIELINPAVVVLLGSVAISSVIGPWNLSDAHGRFYECSGRKYFMTYHPAAALRFPPIEKIMKVDFQILKAEIFEG